MKIVYSEIIEPYDKCIANCNIAIGINVPAHVRRQPAGRRSLFIEAIAYKFLETLYIHSAFTYAKELRQNI